MCEPESYLSLAEEYERYLDRLNQKDEEDTVREQDFDE